MPAVCLTDRVRAGDKDTGRGRDTGIVRDRNKDGGLDSDKDLRAWGAWGTYASGVPAVCLAVEIGIGARKFGALGPAFLAFAEIARELGVLGHTCFG